MTMKGLFPLALWALSLVAGNGALAAQQLCDLRPQVLEHLEGRFHEAPSAIGLTSDGRVVEVLTSAKGSWTIIVTAPDGISCLLAAGQAWEQTGRPDLVAGGAV